MGKSQYVSLQDAALLSGKSPQTIRRLIKGNRVRYRKYKTPQGFTYLVEKSSLMNRFDDEDEDNMDGQVVMNGVAPRRHAVDESELVEEFDPASVVEVEATRMGGGAAPAARAGLHSVPQERTTPLNGGHVFSGHAPAVAMESSVVSQLIQQHREDKKRLFELLEIFQKRILTLEDQVKQLEAPKAQKRWWSFWK